MRGRIDRRRLRSLAFSGLSLTAQQTPDLYRNVSFREIGSDAPGRPVRRLRGRRDRRRASSTRPTPPAASGRPRTTASASRRSSTARPRASRRRRRGRRSRSRTPSTSGTGEANNSRSSYWGDGVYKSTDAGRTWTNVGLKDSQHIGRIVVHPTDPNTVYVAALGSSTPTTKSAASTRRPTAARRWTKSLAVKVDGKDVGAVDVAMDPKNPLVLYAATYDKVRRPWTFAEGGPGSGIYKTIDAGKTWTKLGGGLPVGLLGRIGVVRLAPGSEHGLRRSSRTSALLNDEQRKRYADGFGADSGFADGSCIRSNDAGKTWKQVAPRRSPRAGSPAGRAGVPRRPERGGGRARPRAGAGAARQARSGARRSAAVAAVAAVSTAAIPATTTRRSASIRTTRKPCTC